MSSWVEKLKVRWGVTSGWQVFVILLVFAVTGSSTARLTSLMFDYTGRDISVLEKAGVYFFGLLLYQVLLIGFGFIFGQFTFFWNFEKRMFGRMVFWKKRKEQE